MKNTFKTPWLMTFLTATALILPLTGFGQTNNFIGGTANDDLGDAANWDTGAVNELPNTTNGYSSSDPGILNINATVDGSVSYSELHIHQTGGDVTQDDQGSGGYNFSDGSYLMTGGTWGTRRGITIGGTQEFTVDGGTFGVAIPGGGGDSSLQVTGTSVLTLESGSITVSTDTVNSLSGTIDINGGTFTALGRFGNAGFNGTGGTTNFNGGTTSLRNIDFAGGAGTLNFVGTTAGSVLVTNSLGLSGNFVLNWFTDSQMSLTVTDADATYYQGLYASGDLLFEGSNAGAFGDNFQVSGETLTVIPEPSSIALLGLAGLALLITRRRR